MTAENDRIAKFSTAVAVIYDAIVGDTSHDAVKQALCALLDADEILFTYQQTIPTMLFASFGGTVGEELGNANEQEPNGRSSPLVLSLDIADCGYDKLRLIVVRHPGRPAFTDSELAWLSLLQPHLRNAEMARRLFPDGVLGAAAGGQFARTMCEGLIVVTADDCEIRWLNPAAREILGAGHGLANVNRRLRAARAFETAQIETLIHGAANGRRGAMLVEHADMWLPYGLAFAPLDSYDMPDAAMADAEQSAAVLVTIKDMRQHTDVVVARLIDVFGFTKAEQRIGAMLLAGYSLGDATEIMGKSLATVKKQLRSMLIKTGARSQAELLSKLLSVPSLI